MGSPITLSGFNNIDFKTITDIIIKAEREPITRLEADKTAGQARLTAYGSLNTTLSNLRTSFLDLKSANAYDDLQASSSDSTILTATSDSSAVAGSFTINVLSLARPQVTASAAGQFADISATIFDGGTFSITQGGTTTNLNLAGVDSLSELRDAINSQQSGVKAAIINDGTGSTPFRLVLTSAESGESNAFTFSDTLTLGSGTPGAVLNLSTNPTSGVAKSTEFTYNGITVKSNSTTITDAVPGLSLTVFKEGTANVTVSTDDSSLKSKIKAAVSAFNSFNDFYINQTKLDLTGAGRPPLANDPVLRSINRQLRNYLITDHANSGSFKRLAELGITLEQNGKLKLDEGQLDHALASNRSDLVALFSGDNGIANKIATALESYTKSGGAIDSVETRIQDSITKVTARIQDLELRLATREQQLNAQFTAADQAISQLNSQSSSLSGLANQFRLF